MTEQEATPDQIADLTAAIRELARTREESHPEAKAADGGRYAAALDGSKEIADRFVANNEAKDDNERADIKAQIAEQVKAALVELRSPSMAQAIGQHPAKAQRIFDDVAKAHPLVATAYGDEYRPGELLSAIMLSRSTDAEEQGIGKANLRALGALRADLPMMSTAYAQVDEEGKATLAETSAHGGYVLPNNLVDAPLKPATQKAVLQQLVTVRSGVNVRGVDQPFRTGAPARATFQDWGATKENVDEAYGSYTANLGTLARVYDVGKQYMRFSAGSAEQDVLDELVKGITLGENYYMIAGAGTGSTGVGDPTYGVYTGLNARPGFKSAFASASNSTVAGSFAGACASLLKNGALNAREFTAIIVDATTYFTAVAQGSDNAGFWVNPAGGPTGFNITPSGQLRYWQCPIYYDINLGTAATTKIAIGAEWSAFKLYRGMEFRVDSSDQAGTRWDKNLIGFRGEEEIGFHAGSAIEAGAAYMHTAVIP